MHKLSSFILLFIVAFWSFQSAFSQGTIYVGYCDNQIANEKSGVVTNALGLNADIDLAICLPQEILLAYAGCKITGVNFGMPVGGTQPSSYKAWLRASQSGENLTEGTKSGLKSGWNAISLSKSYTITGNEKEIWVGVSYHQGDEKLKCVSYAGPSNANGAWTAQNGKWTNRSSLGYGSLAIEAIVEGTVPTHNLSIFNVKTKNQLNKIGDPFTVSGTIKNLATETAKKPFIRYSINGKELGSYTIPADIAYRDTLDFSFPIATTEITEDGATDVALELCWADGIEDQAPNDNVAHINIDLTRELFYRKMVVEEGTGAWCGWCVYGIVALREMKQAHPDDFIGIAIHSGDQYEVAGYTNWINKQLPSGFPGCVINRGKEELPRMPELEYKYQAMPNVADAGIELVASAEDGKITFETRTRFYRDIRNTDYRMVFVVVENKLPIRQTNYYAGGARGPMGGFEELESPCDIEVDDVARGIYPSYDGVKGGFPADVKKGTTYYYRVRTDLPAYKKKENLEVVAMLLDGKTGEVVQGAKVEDIYGLNATWPEGIRNINVNDSDNQNAYDLSGRVINTPKRGQLFIQNGRKCMVR